jgi:hypothetical protein
MARATADEPALEHPIQTGENREMSTTATEARLARYKQVEREADEWGRIIGVRRLKPSEMGKLTSMIADISGFDEHTREDGTVVKVDRRTPYLVIGMICEIDSAHIPFAKNRAELDSMYDVMDQEGLVAASKAVGRLQIDAVDDPKVEAKN